MSELIPSIIDLEKMGGGGWPWNNINMVQAVCRHMYLEWVDVFFYFVLTIISVYNPVGMRFKEWHLHHAAQPGDPKPLTKGIWSHISWIPTTWYQGSANASLIFTALK